MKVLEVKNNLVKTDFAADDLVTLGGFLVIQDSKTPFVSQVMNIKENDTSSIAISKLLFTFDKSGVLKNYNGTVPAVNCEVSILNPDELLEILPYETPLTLGKLTQQNSILTLDRKILQNNFLICSDKHLQEKALISNIVKQLAENSAKTIIVDLDGYFEADNKIKFPKDFKLPLNYDTIEYLYERELDDIDATSKAIIQDILIELQEYSKVAEGKFIPFNSFIDIIDMQYKETKVPQLILLKNKLLKYKESEIFAQTIEEAESLSKVLNENANIVLDLSEADCELMQEQILELVYAHYDENYNDIYSFIRLNEEHARKPLLKLLTTSNKVFTTIVCPHDFKYVRELKSIAKNTIFFSPITGQHDFPAYNTLLNKLNNDEFVIIGDSTQQIPFIVESGIIGLEEPEKIDFDETNEQSYNLFGDDNTFDVNDEIESMGEAEPVIQEEDNQTYIEPSPAENDYTPVVEELEQPQEVQDTNEEEGFDPFAIAEPVVLEEGISNVSVPVDNEEVESEISEAPIQENYIEEIPLNDTPSDTPEPELDLGAESEVEIESEPEIIDEPIQNEEISLEPEIIDEPVQNEDVFIDELDNITIDEFPTGENEFEPESVVADELPITEDEGASVIVENAQEQVSQETEEDDFDDFSNSLIHEEPTDLPQSNLNSMMLEEELNYNPDAPKGNDIPLPSDNDEDNEKSYSAFEAIPVMDFDYDSNTEENGADGSIPVYPASEMDMSGDADFNTGDNVMHPTYGTGTVEKVISYGSKKLCSIMFENNNRRLLDPAISSIRKI